MNPPRIDLDRLPDAVRAEGGVSRRLFLAVLAALPGIPLFAHRPASGSVLRQRFAADPFTLGVASGDPSDDGFVLWTKLAPDLSTPTGGLAPDAVIPVAWEVADDEAFTRILRTGTANAVPDLGHSVHVELKGLAPDRFYFYRFRSGDAVSPIGRTRTFPTPGTDVAKLTFAFASCQNYPAGYYTAYQHMAREADLDLVFHLGDYIYEGAGSRDNPFGRAHTITEAGEGPLMTLGDYRHRHMQYRSDADLQAAHARAPWMVTWDDHEVSNNYADQIDGKAGLTPEQFLVRRAAGYRAYYEMMPLRARSLPRGPDMQLYRRASFGKLAELFVLDTRQYRTDQPNNDRPAPLNDAALDPRQTIMGPAQRDWLMQGLAASPGTWNVLAQQVMVGMLARRRDGDEDAELPPFVYGMDAWNGYYAERKALVEHLRDTRVSNPVILTGDVHANYVNEIRPDDRDRTHPVVASEFVGTSISSGGDGADTSPLITRLLADNPHLKYHNRERGYVRCTVTPTLWTADYLTVAKVTEKDAPLQHRKRFVVEAGKPGPKEA